MGNNIKFNNLSDNEIKEIKSSKYYISLETILEGFNSLATDIVRIKRYPITTDRFILTISKRYEVPDEDYRTVKFEITHEGDGAWSDIKTNTDSTYSKPNYGSLVKHRHLILKNEFEFNKYNPFKIKINDFLKYTYLNLLRYTLYANRSISGHMWPIIPIKELVHYGYSIELNKEIKDAKKGYSNK